MNKNVTALILIVLAIGIYFTVTSGVIADAQSVKSVNDQYSSALDNAAKLIDVRDQVRQQYNDISDNDKARLDKLVPSTVDNIRLIIDLSNVALKHGFSLTNIKAAVSSSGKGASGSSQGQAAAAPVASTPVTMINGVAVSNPTKDTVSVSFGATATYDQFIAFMQDLEADLRVVDLTHLAVTANDTGAYTFQVQLTTYWLRQ
ncbi:MAG: hypothetical protein KGI49_02995 [Patescibacteria group bacterium]|nr:hypothetical protein [Patescibacteria group bacterium]